MSFFYTSPIGLLKITLKEHKIYAVAKANQKKVIKKNKEFLLNRKDSVVVNKIHLFLDQYFSGKPLKIKTWPLYPRGTVFQKKVWNFLMRIPYGETKTYTEVANLVGAKGAQRAVGLACAKNPYLILVPCHRVVAKRGLGGFALGLLVKKKLLALEKKKN